ncbi:MAG: methylmalonyl Co-A mutase-associated GTPase MeaB [Chlamydiae bacterium]|nr:methylmalonyl Co-A mutase-associated GTPase MeaB [Chlamydiota bacterium]MBI3265462.1 methylmalonyl Co-A mutase-associated GTPase MeaB [Chlamydiota bacterium]
MKGWQSFFKEALRGEEQAVARILTLLERGPLDDDLLKKIYESDSQIYTIALTGSTGVGKSSLVAQLTDFLARGQYVGIIAMDPRSSISGGAFLGDRIRLKEKAQHPRLFFRSFAPRGTPFSGYITAKTMARALGAFGFGCVLIETQGAGQSDWSLQHLADTTVLVLSPEGGDEIQMMKRGLIEWADIFVINKADRPGAKPLEYALMHELKDRGHTGWKPPIMLTSAQNGQGMDELFEAIEKHHHFLRTHGLIDQRRKSHQELECLLWTLSMTWQRVHRKLEHAPKQFLKNPYEGAKKILAEAFHGRKKSS